MEFNLKKSIDVLGRTPEVLQSFLDNLSSDWLYTNEGDDTWSPYDIVGHLIHGEKTDWLVRIKTILNNSQDKLFEPFDRFAQLEEDQTKSISILINEFKTLRELNLNELDSLGISDFDLTLTGIHPEFGEVTLEQLISTWVVHDLGHLAQISRVMAFQYKSNVGPWAAYLRIVS